MNLYNGNNAIAGRQEFDRAYQVLSETPGIGPQGLEGAILSQSYLRLERLLVTTMSDYRLAIMVNDTTTGSVRETEKRLDLQDVFYCAQMAIYVAKPASVTDYAFKLYTYPSPVVFSTSGVAAAMYTLYNGNFTITVNNRVLVPGFPMSKFLDIPQTQLTAATNSPQDQIMGDACQALQPNPVFVGQKKNWMNIRLPANIAAVETTSYLVVIMYGVLAQNVTIVS